MSKTLNLVLPVPPSVNKYLFPRIIGRGKGQFVRMVETPESKKYKSQVSKVIKEAIVEQGWIIPEQGVKVDVSIDFYFHKKGMDPNNHLKLIYDVFKDCGVYLDDDIAKPQTGVLIIDKYNPRFEIAIQETSEIGIFKDFEDLETFKRNNCDLCSKNSEKCTILRALLESRIHESVEDRTCLKKRERK